MTESSKYIDPDDPTEDLVVYRLVLVRIEGGWTYEVTTPDGTERSRTVETSSRRAFVAGVQEMNRLLPIEESKGGKSGVRK